MVLVDHDVCGSKEWEAGGWHVVFVDALVAVDEDFAVAAVVDVLLALGIDAVVRDDELVVWDGDVETRVDGDGKVAVIAADG